MIVGAVRCKCHSVATVVTTLMGALIRVPDDPSVGTMKLPSLMKTLPMQHRSKPKPIPPPHISKPKPLPPPPPPKKKPIVDKSHLLKKYLHESKSTIQPIHKKKSDTHFRKKSERSNKKKKEEPAKVEKKEEKKVEKEAPKPKPPKDEKKSESVKQEISSTSSSSSVKTPSDDMKFRNSDAREHHFDSAVKRRGSSFDAVVSHSYQVKSSQYDPVAPMGNMDNTKRKSDYQTMPSSANPSQFDSSKNASATILYNKGLPPEPPL
ncbi:unnamed protein product [Orchesella dallaii]|uniref:Uncharacterized protein n=1 Tax=Orchesella dallaii TaxID=48710 RepID=A0ABP1RBE0_9HEXA